MGNEVFAPVRRVSLPAHLEAMSLVRLPDRFDGLVDGAFARLARGEIPLGANVAGALEARIENVLRMTQPDFSRRYGAASAKRHSGPVAEEQLESAPPELVTEVLEELARVKALSEEFFNEVQKEDDKLKGPIVESENFIEHAARGAGQIGEAARKVGFAVFRGLATLENMSEEFNGGLSYLRRGAKEVSAPHDFKYPAPRPGTDDAAEQAKLLSLMAYVGLERLAVLGKADVLLGYFRSAANLIEGRNAAPVDLNLGQAAEGTLQILAIYKAVFAQSMGHPRQVAPFSGIRDAEESVVPELQRVLNLLSRPAVSQEPAP